MITMKRFTTRTALGLAALVAFSLAEHATVHTQIVSQPRNVPGLSKPVRVVRGRITRDFTMTADTYWVLRGAVFVESGATLNIEPGTRVVGELATLGTLVIAQGGRINAAGTATAPIQFTSDQPIGLRARGDWGGLIINGRAPINVPGGVALGEGDTGQYGGTDPDDNSGVLTYVRVEYAGIEFSPDNELNGIAFQGVGRGTTVDHVQVKYNKDDCYEFFGGTVDAKHIIATSCGDDSIDWTYGWTGRLQFGIVNQMADDADNGFEADNNSSNNDLLPRSAPMIYNLTLLGDPTRNSGNESDDGMLVREGTAGTFRNFIVYGFKEWGVNVDHTATINQGNLGTLTWANGIITENGNSSVPGRGNLDSAAAPFIQNVPTIRVGNGAAFDPGLVDPFNNAAPVFRPAGPTALAMQLAPAVPPNDGFFEIAPYIGALHFDPLQDWTTGWTDFAIR
ncbi:MAG: T9SS C-terminal target domain-containing protein [Acidobacteriota bacterium]